MITYINRDRDGDPNDVNRLYMLLNTYNDSEACDGADVFAIEVTPERFNDWRAKMELAKTLKAAHGIAAIVYTEASEVFYATDDDADELVDEDVDQPPDFNNPANLNTVDLIVTDQTLLWEGITKSDHGVRSATVWDYELTELRDMLFATGAK